VTLPAKRTDESEAKDSRRYKREPLTLSGRYRIDGGPECACMTANISPEGIAVITPDHLPQLGEHLVAYFSQLGRVEGTVGRRFETGFVINRSTPAQGPETFTRKIAAALRRRQDGSWPDRSIEGAERLHSANASMTPDEFTNLTAVVRALLERSAA
jgi:PilZ domain